MTVAASVLTLAFGCPAKKSGEKQKSEERAAAGSAVGESPARGGRADLDQGDKEVEPPPAPSRRAQSQPPVVTAVPIETREVGKVRTALFPQKRARRGAAIVTGGRAAVEPDAEAGNDRLIVNRGKAGKRGYATVQLVDLATSKVMSSFGGIVDSSPTAGAIALAGDEQTAIGSIVRLSDGAIVRARPRLPDDKEVARVQAVVRGPSLNGAGSSEVWLFAQAADGSVYHGQWENLEDATPSLLEPFPFWPTGSGAIDRLEVWRAWGVPVGKDGAQAGPCVRMALGGGRAPTCRATEPETGISSADYLAGGWAYYQGEVRNAYDGTSARLLSGCYVTRNASMVSPPRVLAACFDQQGGRNYVLWSPERSWKFQTAETGNSTRVIWGAVKPVFALAHFWSAREEPNRKWLDAERGLITTTEPLQPIGFALNGLNRKFLATRPETSPVEVVLVDLDANTVTTIARIGDCDGRLTVDTREGRKLAMVCSKRTNPKYYRFDVRWTEVIDLDAATRWRTPYFVERFLDGGRIVASDKKRIAGETFAGGKSVFWLELE